MKNKIGMLVSVSLAIGLNGYASSPPAKEIIVEGYYVQAAGDSDPNDRLGFAFSKAAALKNAEEGCGTEVTRISEWTNTFRVLGYYRAFLFKSSATFRCNRISKNPMILDLDIDTRELEFLVEKPGVKFCSFEMSVPKINSEAAEALIYFSRDVEMNTNSQESKGIVYPKLNDRDQELVLSYEIEIGDGASERLYLFRSKISEHLNKLVSFLPPTSRHLTVVPCQ